MPMKRLFCVLAMGVLACACATSIQPGVSRESDLIARHGAPSEEWQQPDGTRVLMYADTPMGYGSTKYIVDKDHTVVAVEPVINEEHFARLRPGMTREEVRRELGRPGEFAGYPRLNEDVWSWRYIEFGNRRMFFNAHFDASTGLLKHTSRSPEPEPILRHPGIGFGFGF